MEVGRRPDRRKGRQACGRQHRLTGTPGGSGSALLPWQVPCCRPCSRDACLPDGQWERGQLGAQRLVVSQAQQSLQVGQQELELEDLLAWRGAERDGGKLRQGGLGKGMGKRQGAKGAGVARACASQRREAHEAGVLEQPAGRAYHAHSHELKQVGRRQASRRRQGAGWASMWAGITHGLALNLLNAIPGTNSLS